MKATVKTVSPNGSFTFVPQGKTSPMTLHSFKYTVEGDNGEETFNANHKTETNLFNPGDEVEYSLNGVDKQGNNKGKISKPDSGYSGGFSKSSSKPKFDQRGVEIGHAINNGVQIAIFLNDVTIETIEAKSRQILELALKMKGEPVNTPKVTTKENNDDPFTPNF